MPIVNHCSSLNNIVCVNFMLFLQVSGIMLTYAIVTFQAQKDEPDLINQN